MKLHTKFAFIVCCAATFSLLSSRADTIPVQVGAGGLIFTPANVTIHVGDRIQWTWAGISHSSTSGTPGHARWVMGFGYSIVPHLFLATPSPQRGLSPTSARSTALVAAWSDRPLSRSSTRCEITRAQYTTSRSQLTVQATDTDDTATLTVSVTSTGEVLGTMTNKGGGNYSAKFTVTPNPRQITVSSNLGGSATARVRVR